MRDIENLTDIKIVVDGFYEKVRKDAMLSPVFAARVPDDQWPVHLQRMYTFWNAILFAQKGFEGNPVQKHVTLPIEEKHFSQWLHLFRETIDENYSGSKADEAKKRAEAIAQIMNFKITTLRS